MKESKENLIMFIILRLNIVKLSVLPKLMIYGFKAIPIKIPARFIGIDWVILQFSWKSKGIRIAQTILKIKNKVGGVSL